MFCSLTYTYCNLNTYKCTEHLQIESSSHMTLWKDYFTCLQTLTCIFTLSLHILHITCKHAHLTTHLWSFHSLLHIILRHLHTLVCSVDLLAHLHNIMTILQTNLHMCIHFTYANLFVHAHLHYTLHICN